MAPGRDVTDRPHVRRAGPADRRRRRRRCRPRCRCPPASPSRGATRCRRRRGRRRVRCRRSSTDLLDLARSADLGDADAAAHVDALGAVQPGHQRPDLLAEHRGQRRRLRFHQDDVDAHAAQAGRHLAADEPGADDDRVPRRARPRWRSSRLSSKDRSTWMPAQIRERRNALGHQARRDDQLVVIRSSCRRPGSPSSRRCPPTARPCRAAS